MPSPDLKNQLEAKIRENPQSLMFARLADIYIENDQLEEAIHVCRQGLKGNPTYITGHYILAKAYLMNNELEKAESALKKVLSHDRHFISAHKHLGDLMIKLGWENTAVTHYRDILKIDPFETAVRDLLANFSEDIGDAVELPASDLMEETAFSSESLSDRKKGKNDEWVNQIREVFPEELSEDSGESDSSSRIKDTASSGISTADPGTEEINGFDDAVQPVSGEDEFQEFESVIAEDASESVPADFSADIDAGTLSEEQLSIPENESTDSEQQADSAGNSHFTQFDLDRLVPEETDESEYITPNETFSSETQDKPDRASDFDTETFDINEESATNSADTSKMSFEENIEDFILPDFDTAAPAPESGESATDVSSPSSHEWSLSEPENDDEIQDPIPVSESDTWNEHKTAEQEEILELPEDFLSDDELSSSEEDLDLKIEIIEDQPEITDSNEEIEMPETIELPIPKAADPMDSIPVNKSIKRDSFPPESAFISETPETDEKDPEESADLKPRILTPTLGEIYMAQEQYDKALLIFKELLELNPGNKVYQEKIDLLNEKIKDMKL